ncbi:MAG TPA: tetratricopeptide repeat protein [Chthoniobacterales bacterium]|nr:tetratricopeptide repeat protein [Chthoniobacterales bacterium]
MFRATSHFRRTMVFLVLFSLGALAGCDRMITQRKTQFTQDADAKVQQGDYIEAVNLYEAALDGTPSSAEVHYKLALLYDDQMNDPLDALHHFKRVLTLEPTGKHAEEVKSFMKRDQLTLLTKLSGDTIVTRAEAVRLQNENLALRKQIEDRWEANKTSKAAEKSARLRRPNEINKSDEKGRTYVVERGDTLASISRKFYKTSSRWGKILAGNPEILAKPSDLKPGQKLRIP